MRNEYTKGIIVTGKMKPFSHTSSSYPGRTNYNDEHGLVAIYIKYKLMLDFSTTGDPCLPTPLTWIECNSDANPRVIALNLNNRRLSGEVPDFSSMDALQRIDLSENRFTGNIPSFLGSFPNLQLLNLSFNLFIGSVPDSIAINKKVKISTYDSISYDPKNFHIVSKQVVAPANGPTADEATPPADVSETPPPQSPSDVSETPPPLSPSDVSETPSPQSPSDVSETPPPQPPSDSETSPPSPPADDESPPSDVSAIAGGTIAGVFVVLSSIAGILFWFCGCCGGGKISGGGGCALCSCSFNTYKDDTVSKKDSNSNAQPDGSPAGMVSPMK